MSMEFDQGVDKYSWAEAFFSPARMRGYLSRSKGDYEQALCNYADDLDLMSQLTILVNLLEVSLRNSLTDQIERWSSASQMDWHVAVEPLLVSKGVEALGVARARLAESGREISGTGVTEALPLVFWVNLLDKRYESTLWTPMLHKAFPHLVKPKRHLVHASISAVYRLRNHIAHQGLVFAQDFEQHRQTIHEILSWISIEGHAWTLNTFDKKVSTSQNL